MSPIISLISIGWFLRVTMMKEKMPTGAMVKFSFLTPEKIGELPAEIKTCPLNYTTYICNNFSDLPLHILDFRLGE